jgi:hypothetical protein
MFCHKVLLTEDAALALAVCSEGSLGANALLLPTRIGNNNNNNNNNNTNLDLQSKPHKRTKIFCFAPAVVARKHRIDNVFHIVRRDH